MVHHISGVARLGLCLLIPLVVLLSLFGFGTSNVSAHAAPATPHAAVTFDAILEVGVTRPGTGTDPAITVYGELLLTKTKTAATVNDGARGGFLLNGTNKAVRAAVTKDKANVVHVTLFTLPHLGTITFPLTSAFPSGASSTPITYNWTAGKGKKATSGTVTIADSATNQSFYAGIAATITDGPDINGQTDLHGLVNVTTNVFGIITQGQIFLANYDGQGLDMSVDVTGEFLSTLPPVTDPYALTMKFAVGKFAFVLTGTGNPTSSFTGTFTAGLPQSYPSSGTWTVTIPSA